MTMAVINYAARTAYRPRYFANDHSRDTVVIDPVSAPLVNGRSVRTRLDAEGFQLVEHHSHVKDFGDVAAVQGIYPDEIVALVLAQSGADAAFVTAPAIRRFSERSGLAGSLDNSMPARFVHIDTTPETAASFAAQSLPVGKTFRRYAHFNIWRCFSGAPQDVGLTLCDARTVQSDDLIEADAIFDQQGKPEWGFSGHIVAHNSEHRWHWFPDMEPHEALIFKTSDSALGNAVPHVAFDNLSAPADCHPRASIEMRVVAYWYA